MSIGYVQHKIILKADVFMAYVVKVAAVALGETAMNALPSNPFRD